MYALVCTGAILLGPWGRRLQPNARCHFEHQREVGAAIPSVYKHALDRDVSRHRRAYLRVLLRGGWL